MSTPTTRATDAHEQHIFDLIDRRLADRIAPDKPGYFVHNDWIITYAQLAPEIRKRQELETRIAMLETRRNRWRNLLSKVRKAVLPLLPVPRGRAR